MAEPVDSRVAATAEMASDIRERHRGLIRDLRIEVVAGGVVLHGHAGTFYGKQVAQHEVMRRSVVVVANRIVVGRCGQPGGGPVQFVTPCATPPTGTDRNRHTGPVASATQTARFPVLRGRSG